MKKTQIGKLHLNDVALDDVALDVEVFFDADITVWQRPDSERKSGAHIAYVPVGDLTVQIELKAICVPLSWTPRDVEHRQN